MVAVGANSGILRLVYTAPLLDKIPRFVAMTFPTDCDCGTPLVTAKSWIHSITTLAVIAALSTALLGLATSSLPQGPTTKQSPC